MDNEAKWIEDSMDDEMVEPKGDFEAEVFLSTDGKNTVHVKALTSEGRKASLVWAKNVYDKLRFTYGTKQAQAVKEYKGELKCETCGAVAVKKEGVGKTGRKWSGVFCQANKEHVVWDK